MPGIITPNFPFAGWMVPPPLDSVWVLRSALTSTRVVFGLNADFADVLIAAFADFCLVAIIVGCFLMRTWDVCKLFMFSYQDGFCKQERSNAQKIVSKVQDSHRLAN
jgi:hypothetical protein